jgi:hypothetical protein
MVRRSGTWPSFSPSRKSGYMRYFVSDSVRHAIMRYDGSNCALGESIRVSRTEDAIPRRANHPSDFHLEHGEQGDAAIY